MPKIRCPAGSMSSGPMEQMLGKAFQVSERSEVPWTCSERSERSGHSDQKRRLKTYQKPKEPQS